MSGFGTIIDSVDHPTGEQIRAAGHRGAALYVGTPGRAKNATPALVRDYLAAGLDLVPVYEDTADSWRAGLTRGLADARAVLADLATLGLRQPRCVFFAVDTDIQQQDMPAARNYFTGAASILGVGRVGVYGGHTITADLLDLGLVSWAWASAGWQHGTLDPRCCLQQLWPPRPLAGVDVDTNVILRPDFGAHQPSPEGEPVIIAFDPTPVPAGAWHDVHPSRWPQSPEVRCAVPARGVTTISSVTCGWAADQDPPAPDGTLKPSGWIGYLRVFWFHDDAYQQWDCAQLIGPPGIVLSGNRSLPPLALPPGHSTFLVARGAWPGGLHLAID